MSEEPWPMVVLLMVCLTVSAITILVGIAYVTSDNDPTNQKMDGWVYYSGGERYVGHDNSLGLCRADDECEELYMGCGAVNCRCVNKTEAEINDFFSESNCRFVSGDGVVCE